MNLIIDVGNTRTKIAVFKQDKLIEVFFSNLENLEKEIKNIFENYKINDAIISKVADVSSSLVEFLEKSTNLLQLNHTTKVPFKNNYKTPSTLGLDRIALISGAVNKYNNQNTLVIDAGTCITYDFVDKKSEYFGGAIAPGLVMRYKSLHHFTAKLPFLETENPKSFIGNSTQESIHSGVVNGVIQEIEGIINQYKNKFLDLTVVLTGGDTKFLSKQLKSSIFANQNFLLEGLNEILIFNKNK